VYVQSTGETSYPVLQKVLVSFGDEIAFEPTLDAALDKIFGGDSGANAGDEGVPAEPTEPGETPEVPEEPGAETPETPQTGAFDEALADAQKALKDREAAYANNDLVGAAEADERLQDALERLFASSSN
jgi:uncharacterized membrane protein (UPF0182 family)